MVFAMTVCLKSGILAKPLYLRIYNCRFRFVVAMWNYNVKNKTNLKAFVNMTTTNLFSIL